MHFKLGGLRAKMEKAFKNFLVIFFALINPILDFTSTPKKHNTRIAEYVSRAKHEMSFILQDSRIRVDFKTMAIDSSAREGTEE